MWKHVALGLWLLACHRPTPVERCEEYIYGGEAERDAAVTRYLTRPDGRIMVRKDGPSELPIVIYSTAGTCAGTRWQGEDWNDAPEPQGVHFVARNFYYATDAHRDAVLRVRKKASAARRELGAKPGRIYWTDARAPALPLVVWESDLPSFAPGVLQTEHRITDTPEFARIVAEMKPLLSRFAGGIYRVVR